MKKAIEFIRFVMFVIVMPLMLPILLLINIFLLIGGQDAKHFLIGMMDEVIKSYE